MRGSRGRGGQSQPRSVELLLASPYHVVNGSYRLVSRRQLTYQNTRDQMWKLDYTPSSLKISNLRTGDAGAFVVNGTAGVIHAMNGTNSKNQMRIVWEADGATLLVKTYTGEDSDEDDVEEVTPSLSSKSSRFKSAPAALDMEAARRKAQQTQKGQQPPAEVKPTKPTQPKTTSRLRKMLGRRAIPPPPPRDTPPKSQDAKQKPPPPPRGPVPASIAPPSETYVPQSNRLLSRPPSNPPPRVANGNANPQSTSPAPLRRSPSMSKRRPSLSRKQREKPVAENGDASTEPKRVRASSPSKKRNTLKAQKRGSLASASMSLTKDRRRSKVLTNGSEEVKANGDTMSRKQRPGLKRIEINLSGELAKLNGSYVANNRHLYSNQKDPQWNIQWHVGKLSLFKLEPHTQYRIEEKSSIMRQELPAIAVQKDDPGHRIVWKRVGDNLSITAAKEKSAGGLSKPKGLQTLLQSRFATSTLPSLMRLMFLLAVCWMFAKVLLLERAVVELGVDPDEVSVVHQIVQTTKSVANLLRGNNEGAGAFS